MLTRQRIILSFIAKAGGKTSHLSLMKWAFLLTREVKSKFLDTFYQFVPYKYGPYSFNMVHELDALKRNGYIIDVGKNDYQIVNNAEKEVSRLDSVLDFEIARLFKKYSTLSASKLITTVYEKYPWYSINTEIKEQRRTDVLPKYKMNIYTAGYQGMQIDAFLNMLLRAGVKMIIDVRSNPISRSYGYHKKTLARLSGFLDIEYNHFPELGIESLSRKNLVTLDDYNQVFKIYKKSILSKSISEIENVSSLIQTKPAVLICQEEDNQYCHRRILAGILSKKTSMEIVELRKPHGR